MVEPDWLKLPAHFREPMAEQIIAPDKQEQDVGWICCSQPRFLGSHRVSKAF